MFYKTILFYILFSLSPAFLFLEGWAKDCNSSTGCKYEHWEGKNYSENALLQEAWAKRFFFDHYTFKGTESILDIGCGDGKITSKMARQVPEGFVIGIDQSSTMIQNASTSYSSLQNLLFLQARAQNKLFYENYKNVFDLVISFTALHWIKEQEAVLKGVYSALKPKGKIYFRLCSDGNDPVYEIANELISHENYKNNFKGFVDPLYRYSVKDYKKFLHDTGFNVISVVDVEDRDEINSVEDLKKQIKSWLPHYHFLRESTSGHLAETFIDNVVLEYEKRIPRINNKIILIDHYLEIIAQK